MARTAQPDLEKQVREVSEQEPPERKRKHLDEADMAPTGATMLNLACSDNPWAGYALGGLVTTPGGSGAGKTIIALSCLADCHMLKRFDDYDLILDDAEQRLAFDMEYLFGESVSNRILSPRLGNSSTIQNFKANLMTLKKEKRKCVYVLDSFDSLSSDEELEKEMRKALAMAKSEEAAKKIAGSYGMEKAKIAGEVLRMINDYLEESLSLLIIIQQRRQKHDAGPFGEKWTTSGGEAPFYYSNHQPWFTKMETLKDKGLEIGTHTKAKLKKNSITGKLRECEFDIYNDYGIDNINSIIDWMLKEEFWKKKSGTHSIDATDLDLLLPRDKLVGVIEQDCLEDELIRIVGECWLIREEEVKLRRKPKYQ